MSVCLYALTAPGPSENVGFAGGHRRRMPARGRQGEGPRSAPVPGTPVPWAGTRGECSGCPRGFALCRPGRCIRRKELRTAARKTPNLPPHHCVRRRSESLDPSGTEREPQ
ncbi:hypothetical protein NDU88_004175 [Pleurodeles waltl]|uniref:Uncharacterized protein n=1 Tax=Pleurodeles waltl TaxID=8319 RepID=A0AAV7T8U7_PLEWA|nr:hypothetical protein NDU88_004175 [Pleurodeles waltl]